MWALLSITTWFYFIIFIVIILWIFLGRGNYEFVGLRNYLKETLKIEEEDEDVDVTPLIPQLPPAKILPKRRGSKKEELCRNILEEIYGIPFPNKRPNFLKSTETNRDLELDCYNEHLGIALEYNGIQHYVWPNFTGQSKENFIKQVRRDQYKVNQCDLNGVYLITVPYNVPADELRSYIEWYLPERVMERKNVSK